MRSLGDKNWAHSRSSTSPGAPDYVSSSQSKGLVLFKAGLENPSHCVACGFWIRSHRREQDGKMKVSSGGGLPWPLYPTGDSIQEKTLPSFCPQAPSSSPLSPPLFFPM